MGKPLSHLHATAANEVQLQHLLDYRRFRDELNERGDSELLVLEKFYAARLLIDRGCTHVYVNPTYLPSPPTADRNGIPVDVGGLHDTGIILAFCETTPPTIALHKKLTPLAAKTGVRTLLLYPFTVDATAIYARLPPGSTATCSIEHVPWLDDDMASAFQDVMALINLLSNETRVKMLLPLLYQTRRKREYRQRINPKLVYENIATLLDHNVLHELSTDEYTLTPIGKQILGEYLTFIQRIKTMLENSER